VTESSKSLRIYFDPESPHDYNDPDVLRAVTKQAESVLTRVSPGLTWEDVAVTVYYYPGGIEHSERHGDYSRGYGFYADLSTTM